MEVKRIVALSLSFIFSFTLSFMGVSAVQKNSSVFKALTKSSVLAKTIQLDQTLTPSTAQSTLSEGIKSNINTSDIKQINQKILIQNPLTKDCREVYESEFENWDKQHYNKVTHCSDYLTILTPQSTPNIGSDWEVRFQTSGSHKLTISTDEKSKFGQVLKFKALYCGDSEVRLNEVGEKIIVNNWKCDSTARLVNEVLLAGKHELIFEYAGEKKVADNVATAAWCNDSNTVALYHLEQNCTDSSSNGLDCTAYGSGYTSSGKFGYGYSITSNSTYLTRSSTTLNSLVNNFTLDAWIYPTSFPTDGYIFNKSSQWSFYDTTGQSLTASIRCGGVSYWYGACSLSLNQWQHVAMTYASGNLKFYVNGNLAQTTGTTCTGNLDSNTNAVYIGKYSGGNYYFIGTIDEVRISNIVRTNFDIPIQPCHPCALSTGGDYTLSTSCALNNEDITIPGNLTIANTGLLDLMGESTLKFSGTPRYMYLNSGGSNLYLSKNASIGGAGDTGTGPVGTWNTTTALPYAEREMGIAAYKGYMYLVGGLTSSNTTLSSVYYNTINSNGTVGDAWSSTTALPQVLRGSGVFAYKDYLYSFCGYTGSSYLNNIYYAPINTNGTIGSWSNNANTLPLSCPPQTGMVFYNGNVYMVGGSCSGGGSSAVYYAAINSNGSIGTWTSTTALPYARMYYALAYRGYIYAIMDSRSDWYNPCIKFYYAAINTNGTVGSWSTGPDLPICLGSRK